MDDVIVQADEASRWRPWMVWAGRIVSVAPVFIVLSSARWKLTSNPWYVREWGRIGWQTPDLPFVASLQVVAIVLYALREERLRALLPFRRAARKSA